MAVDGLESEKGICFEKRSDEVSQTFFRSCSERH